MTRALVTGGAGFIGAHLTRALLDGGWETTILDDLSTGKWENVPNNSYFMERDVLSIMDLVETYSYDVVFHLAAQSSYRVAITEPHDDAHSNILGTLAVCRYCKATGARLVFASSAGGVYGDTGDTFADEDTPPCPTSPYGVSKLAAEEYIKLYARQYGVKAVILRLANVYGPGQDINGEAGVLARWAGQAARGEPLTVRGDGRQTRDFVHVDDVVRAFALAAELSGMDRADTPYTFNISSVEPRDIINIAKRMQTNGIQFMPAIAEEPLNMGFWASRAHVALNWRPSVDFDRGLAGVLQHARELVGEGVASARSEAQTCAQAVTQ